MDPTEIEVLRIGAIPRRGLQPWVWPLILSVGLVALGMALSLWIIPRVVGCPCWRTPGDIWPPYYAAQYVANGAYAYLYEPDAYWIAGPILPVVLAPVAWLGQAFHATSGGRLIIAYPTVWLFYGPFGLMLSAVTLEGVRRIVDRLLTRRTALGLVASVAFLCGVPVAVIYGHYEDMLALGFIAFAIAASYREGTRGSWIWLGLAIATKQWAILSVPLLLMTVPPERRIRWLLLTVTIPAVALGFPLVVDPGHAIRALLEGQAFPSFGHRALWLSRGDPIDATPFRLLPIIAAVAVAYRLRDRMELGSLLGGLGVIFLFRLFVEPSMFAYYLGPPLLFLAVHESILRARPPVRTLVLGTPMVASFWLLHVDPWAWWLVQATFAVALALPALQAFRGSRTDESRPQSGQDPMIRNALGQPDGTPIPVQTGR